VMIKTITQIIIFYVSGLITCKIQYMLIRFTPWYSLWQQDVVLNKYLENEGVKELIDSLRSII